jgi:hypothetical protein
MFIGPIPCMPLENILIPCMPLAPHVIDTKKYTYMPLSGTQGIIIKSDGIRGIFSCLLYWLGVNTKTIFVFIFFLGNEIENGNSGNENDIGNSEISEMKVRYKNYIGYDRNLKFDR